jgi:glutamate synthase domain-containing protein 2
MHEKVVFIGSGKLGFPEQGTLALAMGCDLINVAREAMLSIGCIQAQQCHTGNCPTGVATQSEWLMGGLDPTLKAARLANYLLTLRKELLALSHACGEWHPSLVGLDRIELVDGFKSVSAPELFGYQPEWGLPSADERAEIRALMKTSAGAA